MCYWQAEEEEDPEHLNVLVEIRRDVKGDILLARRRRRRRRSRAFECSVRDQVRCEGTYIIGKKKEEEKKKKTGRNLVAEMTTMVVD
jgi:hypothetical protein